MIPGSTSRVESDRHRAPHRQRQRGGFRRWSASYRCHHFPPIHIGGARHRPLAHQALRLHAAGRGARGAGVPRQRPRAVARAPARRASRPRASPAPWRRWRSTSGRRCHSANVGHHGEGFVPYLLTLSSSFSHEPARPAALGRHGDRQHRGDRRAGPRWRSSRSRWPACGRSGAKGYMRTIFFCRPGLPGGAGEADHADRS